ncbi:hypothetical protein ZYGR_0AK01770 [Zygosaccharomyces rouxii]|uniref:Protein SCD5 n=1 Tax=Zygosaccharomyces rouxii TaxID=4956 RepID=A0A1Q3ADG8_ZYGRO|nr:hypothetical protein ZYGR_0AK01770 [Zygosaccharomyces rouxii]
MSFEWLNIPGLSTADGSGISGSSVSQPPPSVSFNFGAPSVDHIQQPNPTLHHQPQSPINVQRSKANGLNGLASNQHSSSGHDVQYHNGQYPQQYPQQYSQQYPQQYSQQYSQHYPQEHLQHYAQQQYPQQHSHYSSQHYQGDSHGRASQVIQDDYRESPEDLRVPLSLSHSQLTKEEIQTYLRWYTYITARTHVKLVRLGDVFKFLCNFRLSEQLKARVTSIFRTCKNALNIGQFFAVIRLISKSLMENILPERKMVLEKAPVPKPRPILCTNAKEETYEEVEEEGGEGGDKVDFDSFASMLLTGNKPGKKRLRRKVLSPTLRNKKVRFSESVTFQDPPSESVDDPNVAAPVDDEDDVVDFSLPMDQLLKRMAKKKERSSALVSQLPSEQHETEEEKEVLEDMKDSLSHFKQIQTPDMPGVSEQTASGIAPGGGQQSQQVPLQPLKPTSTGSANYLFKSAMQPTTAGGALSGNGGQQTQQELQPLKPTATGSANYLVKSALQPTAGDGAPPGNGDQQTQPELQPLKPTATGSANYLVRSHFDSQMQPQHSQEQQQPQQQQSQPQPVTGGIPLLKPTATGSANYLMRSQFDQQPMGGSEQRLSPNPIVSPAISPDIGVSPQNTNQYLNSIQRPQNQQPLQYQQPVLQQQMSPPSSQYQQPILQPQSSPQPPNPNLLVAPNPAQNYFQSLLSPSPSPSQPNLNVPSGHSNLNVPNAPPSSSPYMSSPNLPSQQGSTQRQQPLMYNNGYQYPSPLPQHQSSQQQPQYYGPAQQRVPYPQQTYPNNFSPMHGQNNYPMPTPGQNYGNRGDILGDLHNLQQQVDALQNVYGRR